MNFRETVKTIIQFPDILFGKVNFSLHNVSYGKNLSVLGQVFLRNKGSMSIGDNVRILSSGKKNPIGGWERTYFQILPGAELILKNGCAISNSAISCANKIVIGENVFIGAGVRIYDTDFHSLNPYLRVSDSDRFHVKTAPIQIDDFAFIGAGSILLKGVTIGKMSVIGAGSVVSCSVPPCEVWAGNPAKFIRKLSTAELTEEKRETEK